MRQKHLESALSSVQREFPNPDVTLEQYPTSPQLTASVILTALQREDVGPGRSVLDLGCGTGMLSLGCALVDTDFVLGVDCDSEALELAAENIRDMEMDDRISLIQARVQQENQHTHCNSSGDGPRCGRRGRGSKGRGGRKAQSKTLLAAIDSASKNDYTDLQRFPLSAKCVDTVLTNPPFGTKPDKAGIDMQFLKLGCRLARRTVYSFYKSSTRNHVIRSMNALSDVSSAAVIAEMKFDLPRTYKFHKQACVDVQVDLIRVELIGCHDEEGETVTEDHVSLSDYHLDFDNGEGND